VKVLRPLIIPTATIAGFFGTPALMMPSANELRRTGVFVDGTGYASAAFLGLFLGALVGYVIRTVLDRSIWWAPDNDDRDRAA
jgi:hypothetical protein